jgi:2-polyprenyl-6-hydroxyphenyl methylase/3-demethylubiquinone-9 3-methyltransferase
MTEAIPFDYANAKPSCTNSYLAPVIRRFVASLKAGASLIDLGCGNGSLLNSVVRPDLQACGIDASASGIKQAEKALPQARFYVTDAAGVLPKELAPSSFDAVISTETIEHLLSPRSLARNAFSLLKPGGCFLVSTPYHGYGKNVVLSLSGRMDAHFTALWDGGHIKFWSRKTLCALLAEAGFDEFSFVGVGRVPFFWKSMIVICRKPQSAK